MFRHDGTAVQAKSGDTRPENWPSTMRVGNKQMGKRGLEGVFSMHGWMVVVVVDDGIGNGAGGAGWEKYLVLGVIGRKR